MIYNKTNEINGFDWDLGNITKNFEKHGITIIETEEVFFNTPLIFLDHKHSNGEKRFHAYGPSNNKQLLLVAFTVRKKISKNLIRVISVRRMSKNERLFYEKESKKRKTSERK
jgi:uncharacterized protein